jgi:two-component system, OmpR family, alkaline phosphatase synthesis response regulator PhoP
MSARILVVEDNPDLSYGLKMSLELEGHEVEVAEDGPSGLERAIREAPDLVILDLMLPGMDGYRVLRSLREEGADVPVLILSARGEEADKVMGFRLGADDYVTKPFGTLELLARVKALLRRLGYGGGDGNGGPATDEPTIEQFGEIEVNPAAYTVTRAGEPVTLAPKEFDLLLALLKRRGTAVSRLDLLEEVWGHRGAVVTRTVDIHVSELRRKLETDPANPRHILTVRKVGYRFEP